MKKNTENYQQTHSLEKDFDGAILLALAMAKSGSDTVDGDSLRFVANAPGEKVGPGDMAKALEL